MYLTTLDAPACSRANASETSLPFFYFPPLDSLPLPPGWRWDSGFAIFKGLPPEQWDEETGCLVRVSRRRRYLPYYRLATRPEPYIPDGFPAVYCLHFDPTYVGERRAKKAKRKKVEIDAPPKVQDAPHRLGAAVRPWDRIGEHLECTPLGSPLVATAIKAGCKVVVAGVWLCDSFQAALQLEALFHHRNNDGQLCPICMSDPMLMTDRRLLREAKKLEQDAAEQPEQEVEVG